MFCNRTFNKNPAYGRHWISRCVPIVAPKHNIYCSFSWIFDVVAHGGLVIDRVKIFGFSFLAKKTFFIFFQLSFGQFKEKPFWKEVPIPLPLGVIGQGWWCEGGTNSFPCSPEKNNWHCNLLTVKISYLVYFNVMGLSPHKSLNYFVSIRNIFIVKWR